MFDIRLKSPNIYISGLYNKYSRFISQTPWELNGEKVFDTSVEEIIKQKFCELYQTEEYKFHSGGREDIDVRMLGNGRPFMIELISPKKRHFENLSILQEIEKFVNQENGKYSKMVNIKNLKETDVKCF